MYKELKFEGVFNPPYPALPEDVREALLATTAGVDPGVAPQLKLAYADGEFFLSDQRGYLCSTPLVDTLICLIVAQAVRPGGAREMLFPGSTLSDSTVEQAQARARRLAESMAEKRAQGPSGSTSDVSGNTGPVKTLGID